MRPLLLISLTIVTAANSVAQFNTAYQQLKADFPHDPAVYSEMSETLNIEVVGDSLSIYSDVFEELIYLKENAETFANKKIYGSHFSEVADLKAKTLVWTNNKYKDVEVSSFRKNKSKSTNIFYDDSYYYSFDFPSIADGNRTQVRYKSLKKEARLLPVYFFSSYIPQAKSSFTIKAPAGVELFYEVLNDPDHLISFNKIEKGKIISYQWSAGKLPAIPNEERSPSIHYFSPHLVFYIKQYKGKTKQVEVLPDLKALNKLYWSFIESVNKDETSSQLKEIVKQIQSDSKSEFETVKNVYYWVQNNIKYIAFEQGMRGLIPHSGSYTCEKRYGDCKDMANLIVNMLEIAGVKAYHTWIGSRELPYKYSQYPTPVVDNHMIATYISKEGEYYFLDGTSTHTPIGYASSMIQGKEALISLSPTEFKLLTVPVIERSKNTFTDSTKIKIVDNRIEGSGHAALWGYEKMLSASYLEQSDKAEVKKYLNRLIGKGSNKFSLADYTISDVSNQDLPNRVDYTFNLGDYFQKIGDELYINLNLTKLYYNAFISSATRKTPIESDYKYESAGVIEFTIPEGYTVEYLPANASYHGKILGHDIRYSLQGKKILYTRNAYSDFLLLEPADFETWNTDVENISNAYKESIILKKK